MSSDQGISRSETHGSEDLLRWRPGSGEQEEGVGEGSTAKQDAHFFLFFFFRIKGVY